MLVLTDDPLRVRWTRSAIDGKFHSRLLRSRKAPPSVKPSPVYTSDWFKPGGACYVTRTWEEVDAPDRTVIRLGMAVKVRTLSEEVKGRIVGISRYGRVWVLVYLYRREGKRIDKWWELRIVDAECIDPIGAGVSVPPPLPREFARLRTDLG